MTSSRFLSPRWLALGLLAALATPFANAAVTTPPPAAVTMTMNGEPAKVGDYVPADVKSLVLDNGILKITFGPDKIGDFSATSVIIKNTELAGNLNGVQPRDQNAERTFYHDYSGSNGILRAQQVKIIQNTPELVHFAIIDNGGGNRPALEDHFVMLPGESGIHPYALVKSNFSGEMRTMYRFDMHLLDWTWTPERIGQQKSYAFLQSISNAGNLGDETWRLPDGYVYTKYDWCLYYAEAPMWGHFGHGFGAWFIPVSRESYAGGPLRQDLAVHQDALILNYIGGGHLGSGGMASSSTGGVKIHGPWYVYFNSGPTPEAIIADAQKTALAEEKKWPYTWVQEPTYPIKRTTVTGQLVISHDRSAANAYVILAQPGNAGGGGRGGRGGRAGGAAPGAPADAPAPAAMIENFSSPRVFGQVAAAPDAPADPAAPAAGARRGGGGGRGGRGGAAAPAGPSVGTGGAVPDRASVIANQGGDYIYYVKADADGKFTLTGVRPGTYTLYAWQTQGPITQSFAKDGVVIQGEKEDLGKIAWDAPYHPRLLMQIGKADRMADEFKFGNGPREYTWIQQVPQNLTFTVGKNKELDDWYYAQKTGVWTVNFNVDKPVTGNAYLTVPIAGGTASVQFAVNGQNVGSLNVPDDGSVRRQANRSGRYSLFQFTFPGSVLKQGENTLTLTANGAGIMYDTIVLESD